MPRLTIHELFEAQKNGRQFAELFVDRLDEARALAEAGVEIMMCMHANLKAFRAVAPDAFIITADGVGEPDIASPEQCVAAGFACMQDGADAVYTGMSLKCVEAMAREMIPTIGHVGYVPYRATWIGGPRAVGKTGVEAAEVYRHVKAYEDAGAVGVEMEIVPARVLDEIVRRTNILVMSMGSGTAGVCQYLFATDVLGTNQGHVPRHSKVYADLYAQEQRLHQMRVDAMRAFKQDVNGGAYPEPKHTLKIKDDEFDKFLAAID